MYTKRSNIKFAFKNAKPQYVNRNKRKFDLSSSE